MPSLFRPTVTRYLAPDGTRVPKGTRGARKVSRKVAKWYGQGIPGWPPRKRVPLATDKTAARRMLDDLVRRAERGATDLPDATAGRTALADLLARFAEDLPLGLATRKVGATRRPSPRVVGQVCQRLRDALAWAGLATAAELASGARPVLKAVTARVDAGGLSHQSAAHLMKDLRRFCWWLHHRAGCPVRADLFDAAPGFDPDANRTFLRRPVTPPEFAALLDACGRPDHHSTVLKGRDRRALYLTAYATGYRAEELAKLTPANFLLDADPPAVVLRAGQTKNKRRGNQPIPPAVADHLRGHLAGRDPAARVWPGKWYADAAEMLARDLKAAGVPVVTDTPDGPATLDFHALRHSYGTAVVEAGATPKEAQELLRHSDPRLTLGLYAHTRPARLGEVVGRLPLPGPAAGPTLATLSRGDLEALAAVLLAACRAAGFLVAPVVAPGGESLGHSGAPRDTAGDSRPGDRPRARGRKKTP